MDNILLLDLDGVLIITPSHKSDIIHIDGYSDFDTNCVYCLNKIIDKTGYDIVLTSSRRFKTDIDKMNIYFKNRNIKGGIIAYLPDYGNISRASEIEKFINENNIKNYLIIDDDKSISGLNSEIKKNWIQTYKTKGLCI
jgi:hypothetical protein